MAEAVSPDTSTEAAEPVKTEAERIRDEALSRRAVERTLDERYINPPGGAAPEVVPAAQTNDAIEEGIASGLFARKEGTPDPNFPGDLVVPGKEGSEGILLAMRANQGVDVDAHVKTFKKENKALDLPVGVDPEVYVNDVINEGRQQGLWKETTGRGVQPDGFFAGDSLMGTSKKAIAELARVRGAAEAFVRGEEATVVTTGMAGSAGHNLGIMVEQAIRDGKIDVTPGGGTYSFGQVADKSAAGISRIYAEVYRGAIAAVEADPDVTQKAAFKAYMDSIVGNLDTLRAEGVRHREEVRAGVDTASADAARARIEALDLDDAKWAPETNMVKVAGLDAAREALEKKEKLLITRGKDKGKPSAKLLDEAYAQDSVAAAGGRVEVEFRPRIDALQAQIDAAVDRNLRTSLEGKMTALLAERGTAEKSAMGGQEQRTVREAEMLARDPGAAARHKTFDTWFNDPATITIFERTGTWQSIPAGEWAQMKGVQREAATPLMNQAAQARRAGDLQAAEEFQMQAFEASEKVRGQYEAKVELVHQGNNAAEQRILEASGRGESLTENLGRSGVSPELNMEIVNDMLRRFNMPVEPAAVMDAVGPNGDMHTPNGRRIGRDLIFQSPTRPGVALVTRYDNDGRMLSADLITVKEGVFRTDRKGVITDSPTRQLRERIELNGRARPVDGAPITLDVPPSAPEAEGATPDAAGATPVATGGGGGSVREAGGGDWSGFAGAPELSRDRGIRATQLRLFHNMPPEMANLVTRYNTVRQPKRNKSFFQRLISGP